MKSSFVSQINLMQAQADNKPKSFNEQRKSRQNSKQGHMNPLKMKTSFLRQSLTLNTSEQNLSLNLNNPVNVQRNITPVQVNPVPQSDRRQDFMMRKIVERFTNNSSPKNIVYPEHGQYMHEMQRERDIIRLSGRKNEHMGMSQMHKHLNYEKQNNQKSNTQSSMNHSGVFAQNQHHFSLNLDKNHRQSQDSTTQSVVLDNSLADYASINNSFVHNDHVSVLKEQLQLVLKRLAKNQCEIQALKRDKSIDAHMQCVWKQLSLCENKFEIIEKRCARTDEKVTKFTQEMQYFRSELTKMDHAKLLLTNHVQALESKLLGDISNLQQRLPNITTLNQESQRINDVLKTIKTQMQGMFKILNVQFENRIETKFSQMKWDLRSDKVVESQQDKETNFNGKNSNKFILSSKKAHESIALVYKELLKVNRSTQPISQEQPYNTSDRTKLLESALKQPGTKRTTHSSSPVSPQATTTPSYFTSQNLGQSQASEIEINSVEYFIDPEGYLLDQNQFYILDEKGQQIRLDAVMIELMKQNELLKC